MAQYLSPGVYWNEVDLTTIVPQVSTTVGALVGHFEWGPVNEIYDVPDENTLVKVFHEPVEFNYKDFFTAANFLTYANSLKLVRAANTMSILNATSGSGRGLLIRNFREYEDKFANLSAPTQYGLFAARYPGDLGNSLKVSMFTESGDPLAFASWEYSRQFTTHPTTTDFARDHNGHNDELYIIVIDAGGKFTGVPGTVLEKYTGLSKASDAIGYDGGSIYYVDAITHQSNYIYILQHPSASIQNLQTTAVINGGAGVFPANNIPVLGGSGTGATVNVYTDGAGVVTEVQVVSSGDGYYKSDILHIDVLTGANAVLRVVSGDDANGNVASITVSQGGLGYINANGVLLVGGTSGASGLTANVTVDANGTILTADVATEGLGYVTGDQVYSQQFVKPQFAFIMADNGTTVVDWGKPALNRSFGQDYPWYTAKLQGGVSDAPRSVDLIRGYDLFADADSVDVSLIMTSSHPDDVCRYVIDAVVGGSSGSSTGRRDAVAFVSPPMDMVVNNPGMETQQVVEHRNKVFGSSSYAVMDSCWKRQFDKYNNMNRWVPLNGDIAGLCARTDYTNDSWWSPAGFNRGQIKNSLGLSWNAKQSQRDQLYSNGINPVVNFRGEGPILYGDKTMQVKPSAFDRINVRRLFITLEKAITRAAKYSLFEFNDQFTRAQFVALIEPYLRDVKARRGIYDFRVVCDETNNTPEVIDSNKFIGDIYIKPARSINFIQLNFVAVRTGVDFSTVVGQFG